MSRRPQPHRRTPATDQAGPPLVRQLAREGPTAVMRTAWRDPDDVRPNAQHRPREIEGFRRFCPLRWMIRRHGGATKVTELHVHAADRLRAQADVVMVGYSAERDLLMDVGSIAYGPVSGPSEAAVDRAYAGLNFARVMQRFRPGEREMLTAVVLLNHSLAAWCLILRRRGEVANHWRESERLIALLDRLVELYGLEMAIEAALGAEPVAA